MRLSKWVVILLTLTLLACKGNNKTQQTTQTITFKSVEPPALMTDPQARVDYMATHWWDNFDFADTAYLSHPEVTEQALADYLYILPMADQAKAKEGITLMMGKATADSTMYAWFREETEHYLWDPNSPIRNESLYMFVLETIVGSGQVDDLVKIRAEKQLETARKNRPGMTATDFTYTLNSGRQAKLSQIRSEYTLLFISNPGCPACGEIIAQIKSSPALNQMEQSKRLTVLTLYPDEDLEAWHKYLPDLPADWINAYDKILTLRNDDSYDMRAIPTLYLLDKDKTVLIKDATFEQLETYLVEVLQRG